MRTWDGLASRLSPVLAQLRGHLAPRFMPRRILALTAEPVTHCPTVDETPLNQGLLRLAADAVLHRDACMQRLVASIPEGVDMKGVLCADRKPTFDIVRTWIQIDHPTTSPRQLPWFTWLTQGWRLPLVRSRP